MEKKSKKTKRNSCEKTIPCQFFEHIHRVAKRDKIYKMDTPNQDQNQQVQPVSQSNPQPVRQQSPVTPAAVQSVQSPVAVKPPAPTVTLGGKEAAPIGDSAHVSEAALRQLADDESEDTPPMVTAHPVEVERGTEVQNAGVTEGTDTQIKLSQELQDAGVAHAKAETPVAVQDDDDADLPMPYAQAVEARRTNPIHRSLKWFASEVLYQYRRLKPDLPK